MEIRHSLEWHVLDLTDDLRINGKKYYFEHDGHWNKQGHAFVANILKNTIADSEH